MPKMRLAGLGLLVVLLPACGAMHAVPEIDQASLVSAERDIAMAESIEYSNRSALENEAIARRAFGKLRSVAWPFCERADYGCHFRLFYHDEDRINAYAYGNGEIHFFDGLARILESEDEFAAVLAHEMGHHIGHHLKKKEANARIGQALGVQRG